MEDSGWKAGRARSWTALFLLSLAVCAHAAPDEVTVAGYNVENYMPAGRVSAEGITLDKPKPQSEIDAVVRIVKEINADILGVSEMGPKDAFEDFKARLSQAGLGYKDFEYVDGPDPARHLALLSRYPIVSRQSVPDAPYSLDGLEEKAKRGFLDVTVRVAPDYDLRLVGVHLKSKLAAPEGEALVRRNEAHLLRGHIEKILAADPSVNLMLYGDFNDTKNEPAIREIMGARHSPDYMFDLWLKDSLGDRWTEYWKAADIYSRIDYIFVNGRLFHQIDLPRCSVYRSDHWQEASDHRPTIATIIPGGRP